MDETSATRRFRLGGLLLTALCLVLPLTAAVVDFVRRGPQKGVEYIGGDGTPEGSLYVGIPAHAPPTSQAVPLALLILAVAVLAAAALFNHLRTWVRPGLAGAAAGAVVVATAVTVFVALGAEWRRHNADPLPGGPLDLLRPGNALWLCLVLTSVGAVGNLAAWLSARHRPA